MTGELARRCAGLAPDEVRGHDAQLLQARRLLGGALGREQGSAALTQRVDQPGDERSWLERVQTGGDAAVQLEETLDALARLGRDLRRLGGSSEAGDHVELASTGELNHTRELHLAQLDRRARVRAHD